MNYINLLLQVIEKDLGKTRNFTPRLDGSHERFALESDRGGKKSGWLVGSVTNDVVSATFGNWKTQEQHYFCSKQRGELSDSQWQEIEQRRKDQATLIEAEKEEKAAAARVEATEWLKAGNEAAGHGYLLKKGIQALGGVVKNGSWLDAPVFVDGKLSTLQRINEDGQKRFLSGGKKKAGYLLLGTQSNSALTQEEAQELFICEGYATGCSIYEALGKPTAVAFDAGNLCSVGEYFRALFPDLKIVFCADNDHETELSTGKNPGLDAATAAAEKVGGFVFCPDFSKVENKGAGLSDFNDLHRAHSLDLVGAQIEQAITQFSRTNFSENTLGTNLIKQKNSEKEDFGELLPIPEGLLPVEAFDFDLLPLALRGWVEDTSNRMQCPPDFVAAGAMVALSSVIGRKAVIRPKQRDNWEVVPNLWGMVVGRPGVMKSPALAEMMRPLNELQRQANADYKQAQKDLGVNAKLAALTQKDTESRAQKLIKSGDSDGARALLSQLQQSEEDAKGLKARRYIANDASVEALGEILADNPNGILAYRDELHGLLSGLDKPGQEGSRAFYLQSYDGNQSYTFDRILRGLNIHIPAVCLAMLGGIQPGKLRAYVADALEGGAGDDGLLQRFGLTVWPDIPQHWQDIDRDPNKEAAEVARAVFMRLDALPVPGEEQPPITYRFAPDALELFKEWRYELETELRTGGNHPALESHISKYRKLMPALALVIGVAEGEEEYISRASTIRACLWIQYLRSHAERVYAAGANRQYDTAKLLLDKIKAGKIGGDTFKAADVYLKGWAGLGSPSIVNNACALLCEFGYLKKVVIEQEGRGRPNESYAINPKLRG